MEQIGADKAESQITNTQAPEAAQPKTESREKSTESNTSLRGALRSNFKDKAKAGETLAKAAVTSDALTKNTSEPQGDASTQQAILPPADMNAKEKEAFAKLSPDAQAYISRRAYEMRSDYRRQTLELEKTQKEVGDVIQAVPNETWDEYTRQGISKADLVRRTVAWDKALKSSPTTAAREFLDTYGIDPREIYPEYFGGASPVGGSQSPAYNEQDISSIVEERVQQIFEQQQQAALANDANTAIQSFLGSKPLFKDPGTGAQLENAMAPIVAGLRLNNPSMPTKDLLETAYNYVTRGDPTFSSLVSRLDAKSDVDRMQAEATKAKAASRSISGGPGSGSPKQKSKDIRESLRRNFSRA